MTRAMNHFRNRARGFPLRRGIVIALALSFFACDSDCIYKTYTNRDGDELCGRFCPISDDEGNDVTNVDNEPVYELDDTVNNINCNPPTSTGTTTTSSSSTSSTDTAG